MYLIYRGYDTDYPEFDAVMVLGDIAMKEFYFNYDHIEKHHPEFKNFTMKERAQKYIDIAKENILDVPDIEFKLLDGFLELSSYYDK